MQVASKYMDIRERFLKSRPAERRVERFRQTVEKLLAEADIRINGSRPWDIHVYNNDFFPRVLAEGSLGLGESYMDGWWDSEQLDEFFCRILRAGLDQKVKPLKMIFSSLVARIYNFQTPSRSFRVGEVHYDIGNDLYSRMLDKLMIYSCAYWKDAATLDEAQEAKLDLIARKLDLRPGMKVVDVGCGWGGTAKFLAENYGVRVVGITVSKEQAAYAKELCKGLPVEIRLEDYRKLDEKFDRVISVGMFEHVGYKNYRTFMKVVRRCLKEDGLFLLHTIGSNISMVRTDPWIEKYIFPNSMLPSAKQICEASEGIFVMEDWHNFSTHYDKTLMAWYKNFENAWNELKEKYGDRFYRMWRHYLLSCAGAFRARVNQLWQIVFSPEGVPGGYDSIR